MINKRLFYYILTCFITGNLILVFIQYNSARSIESLIGGNENLMSEIRVSNELKELEKDVVSVDNSIRRAVSTKDTTQVNGIEIQIAQIKANLDQLQKIDDNDSTEKHVDELDRLIQQKLLFNSQVLDTFYHAGKLAADSLLVSHRGKNLIYDILDVTNKIDRSRQGQLAGIIASTNTSSRSARSWGTILISLVILSGIGLFLFIVSRIKQQQLLIQQLDASEKKVREVARIKENFLANMSHEIRTPMTAMLGYTNLLQRKNLDEESGFYVSTIRKSGETLLSIINDVLDISKIEAGMMRIEETRFNVRALVHSVETMFRNKIQQAGLSFEISISPDIPETVMGDATRLSQVLINLVGNSIKFTKAGSISIELRRSQPAENIIGLNFRISDTGIGIEKEKLETIFERFRQAEDSTTRIYGGTGLGLSIVKDIITLQHGTIYIESQPGTGTSITVSIPYKIIQPEENIEAAENNVTAEPFIDNISILVVEDNVINQQLMQHLLREWHIANTIVNNGKEAIEILSRRHFDLVLMDIQMPEMDGYTATQEIRQTLKLDIPIIAMTAHAMAGEREKCLSYGMNEHIPKPIKEKDLYNAITRFTKIKPDTIQSAQPATAKTGQTNYTVIDLSYMKEISNGNKDYEKTVTEQFIEIIPAEIESLKKSFKAHQYPEIKRIAHNMKTSISVMGLNTILDEYLDHLENNTEDVAEIDQKIKVIEEVCTRALKEAEAFLASL